jgi:hypothetical protein
MGSVGRLSSFRTAVIETARIAVLKNADVEDKIPPELAAEVNHPSAHRFK